MIKPTKTWLTCSLTKYDSYDSMTKPWLRMLLEIMRNILNPLISIICSTLNMCQMRWETACPDNASLKAVHLRHVCDTPTPCPSVTFPEPVFLNKTWAGKSPGGARVALAHVPKFDTSTKKNHRCSNIGWRMKTVKINENDHSLQSNQKRNCSKQKDYPLSESSIPYVDMPNRTSWLARLDVIWCILMPFGIIHVCLVVRISAGSSLHGFQSVATFQTLSLFANSRSQ